MPKMRWLETRILPPFVMLLLGVAAFGTARTLPALTFVIPGGGAIAIAFAAAGMALNILPKVAFRRAGTTVNPVRPDATTHLITSGVYRYTRNPMYLGHATMLLGWVLYLQNATAVLAVPAFMLYITRFQILAEERQLSTRFRHEYAALCKRVPRWL